MALVMVTSEPVDGGGGGSPSLVLGDIEGMEFEYAKLVRSRNSELKQVIGVHVTY